MKEKNIYLNKILFYSFLLLFCSGFILLFTSSSPYRKDQFAVRIFLQVVIVLIQVYDWEIRYHSLVCLFGLADIFLYIFR